MTYRAAFVDKRCSDHFSTISDRISLRHSRHPQDQQRQQWLQRPKPDSSAWMVPPICPSHGTRSPKWQQSCWTLP